MKSIIKTADPAYARYEEVLLRRDNLRKEAEQYHLEFIKIFGDLITESFTAKIECIRRKKMIAYCQRMMNIGKDVDRSELTKFIEREMAEYQDELQEIISSVKTAKGAEKISAADVHKIKKIYYALVKLIHPDMHPELAGEPLLKEYWERIVTAYRHNDLTELEQLDALVRMYLEGKDGGAGIQIPDIEEKIAKVKKEIEEILSTEPYLYKLLITDESQIEERKREYQDEIEAYKNYARELDEVLETFEIKEGMLS